MVKNVYKDRAAPEQKVLPYVTSSCWPRVRVYRSNISANRLPMVMESSLNFEVAALGGELEGKPFCALWGKC